MVTQIIGCIVLAYVWLYIRGMVWVLHAIFAVGSVVIQIGIDIRKPASVSMMKIILKSFVAIPALGLFVMGPKRHFLTLRERMIEEVTQLLLSEGVSEHTRNVFEASVRANLGDV